MKLNQTPIRTSINYGINDISIEKNANFIQKIENFNNLCSKFNNFEILNDDCVSISTITQPKNSLYLNEELKNEIFTKSNLDISIDFVKNTIQPVVINFNFDKNNDILIGNINLKIKNDVRSKIILNFNSENIVSYNNTVLNIELDDESTANIILIDNNNSESDSFFSIESNIQKNANLSLNIVNFTSKNSIYSYKSNILGENSESNLNNLYLGSNNSIIDLNYMIDIYAPNSRANIDVIGAISENAKKHFKGTIDFKKGCTKSVGEENEFCILLSKNAKSKALPMILCTEEDVDGKHSSAVGKVDEKQLFYVMSRGFTYSQALKILVKAKFNGIIEKLFDEESKQEILNKIDGKIV